MQNGFKVLSCSLIYLFLFFFSSLLRADERVHICLTLWIEDDRIIEQCLNSTGSVIDCACICVIGKNEHVLKIIENFKNRIRKPVKVCLQPTADTHFARTALIKEARNFLIESGYCLEDSYFLLLQSDMYLTVNDRFDKEKLMADRYLVLEKSLLFSYHTYFPHLLRASLPWESRSKIPENWSCEQSYSSERLMTLRVNEEMDETCKTHRLKEVIISLNQAIKDDPQDPQFPCLLAQAYHTSERFESAVQWYMKRLKFPGSDEEIWFCRHMLGECFEAMGKWEHALYWYLEAFQAYPGRVESLEKIATHYRWKGENQLAYLFAKHGSQIPYPSDQTLFPLTLFRHYEFDEEMSIAAYYTPFREEGYHAINRLIFKRNVPRYVKDQAYQNILFYVQNLSSRLFPIQLDLPLIEEGIEERYHPMNPSIQKTEDGYRLICRAVNYTQKGARDFQTVDSTGVFRTKNFLIDYDREFHIRSQNEIIENLSRERIPVFNVEGLEDCRIFTLQNHFWFTCTTCDTNPTGNRQISLCKLRDEPEGEQIFVEKLLPLIGTDLYRCEKNWLPFVKEDSLLIVYSYDPFVIYKPDPHTGHCQEVVSYQPDHDFSQFRGSAAPIPFDEGYLMLVHEVVPLPEYERCYLHRFLYLDKDFHITRQTHPFTFLHRGVEYCCSMTIDHTGKQLILPIGIEDQEAYLCFVNLDWIRSLLNPLPTYIEDPFSH